MKEQTTTSGRSTDAAKPRKFTVQNHQGAYLSRFVTGVPIFAYLFENAWIFNDLTDANDKAKLSGGEVHPLLHKHLLSQAEGRE